MRLNKLMPMLAAVAGTLTAGAVDGTWAGAATGTWTDSANWIDGIIPDGGTATFNGIGAVATITVGSDAPAIGGLAYSGAHSIYFTGGTLPLVAPALLRTEATASQVVIQENVLSASGDVTVNGPGFVFLGLNQSLNGRLVVSNGWVRTRGGTAFGPIPETLIPDAIILDGGCLQNGTAGTTTVPATRGIYVREAGGYFCAGYTDATFDIASPVTGPGPVYLNYEFSKVVFSNPANDWLGDTVLGVSGIGVSLTTLQVKLGADEVIPHGGGRGILRVGEETYHCNYGKTYRGIPNRPVVQLDLAGHAETVNGLTGGIRANLKSTGGASTLTLAGDGDSFFRGSVESGATLVKQGTGTFDLSYGSLGSGAGLTLDAGRVELAPYNAKAGSLVTYNGGTLRLVPYGGLELYQSATGDGPLEAVGTEGYPTRGGNIASTTGKRSVYRARWTLPVAGTYSFVKSFCGTAKLVIDGNTVIDDANTASYAVVQNVALAAGGHEIELTFIPANDGLCNGQLFNGIMYDAQNGAFATDAEKDRARYFSGDFGDAKIHALVDARPFTGGIRLNADCTLEVDPDLGPITLAGPISSSNGSTLTIPASAGVVTVGSGDSSSAAVLDATVVAQGGLVLTNNVWLRAAPPTGATIATGTSFTLDYADAFASGLDLSTTSARATTQGLGDGTIVVRAGQTFRFDTQVYSDGVIVDGAEQTRAYANDVVLDGGTLYFSGSGTITYTGRITGTGRIERQGSGTVVFGGDASALTADTEIVCAAGTFLLGADGSLGGAKIGCWGGRFGLGDGQTRTLANPVDAHDGGFLVGTGSRLELGGLVQGFGGVSLWGTGTLALVGEGVDNTVSFHVRGGVLELAKSGSTAAVDAVLGCVTGAVVRVTGASTRMIANSVRMDGGTFDLNGHDVTLNGLWDAFDVPGAGGHVVNNGSTPATLTIDDPAGSDHVFSGDFEAGSESLGVVKSGAGRLVLDGCGFANERFAFRGGRTELVGAAGVTARKLRFTALKSRPSDANNANKNTGIQFGEFILRRDGVRVAYPAGTTASAPMPSSPTSSERAEKAIDNNLTTKWYAADSSMENCVLTIDFGEPFNFDSYQFATANDSIGRDPYSWKIEVSFDGTTWVEIDRQTEISLTTTRNAVDGHVFPVIYLADSFPVGMDVEVGSDATLALTNLCERFEALVGDGVIELNASDAVFAGTTSFSGTVVGAGSVTLDGAVDGFGVGPDVTVAAARATELVYYGSAKIAGVLNDGAGALAVAVDASNAVVQVGGEEGNGYTGATTVRRGQLLVSGARRAKYFRFEVLKTTGNVRSNAQISRIDLRRAGATFAWPAGTTAETTGANPNKGEGAEQLIDGNVYKKCYWSGPLAPVVITCPDPVAFDGYDWYTANDSIQNHRQPVSWTLEYSEDGVTWTLFDQQTDNPATPNVANYALAYTYDALTGPAVRDALPDASAVTVAAEGTLTLDAVQETIGALAGAGTVEVQHGSEVTIDAAVDAAFSGTVTGAGTLAKAGAGTQALSGAITFDGTLVVEEGVLDVTGATLTGITNIVLRGGALVGAATVAGDLTVTSEGGAYGATLAVSGRLALVGTLRILAGCTGAPVRATSFTYASTDAASLAVYKAALLADALPNSWVFVPKAVGQTMSFSISMASTVIYLR